MLTCWARSLSREVKRVSLYVPIRTAFNPPIHSVDEMDPPVRKLLDDLKNGSRAALARSITLIENNHPYKKKQAKLLLNSLLHDSKLNNISNKVSSFRIGLSGSPGTGKSTFIEYFGKYLTGKNMKVAVLAVDPSSAISGGSLLGDKTRMHELSRDMNAFIRPSPSRGHLGGVARSTDECIILCEAAGYDIIIVETVGVGQSEFAVSNMVDLFTLLIAPGQGDELQGIKRGIVEMSDLIVINKSDGDLLEEAQRTQYEYISATKYLKPKSKNWKPPIKRISSINGDGIVELWDTMCEFKAIMVESKEMENKRKYQQKKRFWDYLQNNIVEIFMQDPQWKLLFQNLELQVLNGDITPGEGADLLFSKLMDRIYR